MLLAYIKAENIKNRHTVAANLFWIVPLISISEAFFLSPSGVKYYQMLQFNNWYTILFPMLLLLSTAFTVRREKKLKNRVMAALPLDMKSLWAAKVFYSIKTSVLAMLILYCAEELISRVGAGSGGRVIGSEAGLFAIFLLIAVSLWQIPFWLFINELFGFAAAFIMGLVCNIGLGILGALSSSWALNPFSYMSRLMCPVIKVLPNGLPAQPGNQTFFPGVLDSSVIPVGVFLSLLLFVICFGLTAVWYKRKGAKGWEN